MVVEALNDGAGIAANPRGISQKRWIADAFSDGMAHHRTEVRRHNVWISPPSMTKSAPVTFPARPLASTSTRSATSSGVVNRFVAEPDTAPSTIADGSPPLAAAKVSATPPAPSQSGVLTGPGLIVLTRMPYGPSSLDSALEKLVSAAFAAV